MGIKKIIQLFILPVRSKCVLNQIIGTDAEKIHQLCQFVAYHHRCRCFNHDPLLRKHAGNLCPFQFFLYFSHNDCNLLYLFHRSDHGIHNRKIAEYCRTKQRTKLCFKNIRLLQADTDGAIAKSRIFLFSQMKIIHLLICTDVQCPDDNLFSGHCLHHLSVCLELLFLCGKVFPSKIKEFTSEQPNPSAVIFQNISHIPHASNVGINIYPVPIQRNIIFSLQCLQKFQLLLLFFYFFFRRSHHFFRRIKDNHSFKSIYHSFHSGFYFIKICRHSHQRRDIHHAGKNGSMRICRTMNCYKGKDFFFIHLNSFTGA